jgi:hypothetical protein
MFLNSVKLLSGCYEFKDFKQIARIYVSYTTEKEAIRKLVAYSGWKFSDTTTVHVSSFWLKGSMPTSFQEVLDYPRWFT